MTQPWTLGAVVVTHFLLVLLSCDVSGMPEAKQDLEQPLGLNGGGTGSSGSAGLMGLLTHYKGLQRRLKRSVEETRPSAGNSFDRIRTITHLMKSLGPEEAHKVISALAVIREFLLKQKSALSATRPETETWAAQTQARQQRNYHGAYPDFKEEVRRMGPEFNPTGW
jgi:hypothetical protein